MYDEMWKAIPQYIETPAIVLALFLIYKTYQFFTKKNKERMLEENYFKAQVLAEEREKSKVNERIIALERDLAKLNSDLREHKLTYSTGFRDLSQKVDKIIELLIKPGLS